MKVLVVGATGATGQAVVKELQSRGIPLRALVRSPSKAIAIWGNSVETVEGNVLDRYLLPEAIGDCTHIICATGARPSLNIFGPLQVDYLGTKNLVKAALSKNIAHLVLVSSLLTSVFFHPLNLFWLVLFWKKQAERYIEQSGITYTIVRPGGLTNTPTTDNLVMGKADTLFSGRIPRSLVAQVCVEALFCPAARNKIVEVVTSPTVPHIPIPELFAQV
ncbi:MAG: SDR family oxidoreductase [Pseudanabaenaceae cyanobacterium SKYGB_i_bin29]|nr:SDR family oxidoreductase [Pseudanabaenaceae cyanobacterium SKYG29]MDW8420938.1 SDR family oxidoreductase [Pseudanabaenaceae cyanobacterium SKYGB_i_bin29]